MPVFDELLDAVKGELSEGDPMKDTGAFVYVVDGDASAGDSSLTILRQEPGAFEGATGSLED